MRQPEFDITEDAQNTVCFFVHEAIISVQVYANCNIFHFISLTLKWTILNKKAPFQVSPAPNFKTIAQLQRGTNHV